MFCSHSQSFFRRLIAGSATRITAAALARRPQNEVAVPMAIIHFRCKERRRTVRVMLSVPLRVSGKTEIGEKFSVKTLSHSVSLHGASIELEQGVVLGEILELENVTTEERVEGKGVSIRRARDGKPYVAG